MIAGTPLDTEISYYEEHLPELLDLFRERFIVIKGVEVFGAFPTESEALRAAASKFGLGPYLIRRVTENPKSVSNLAYSLGLIHASPR